ncbi:MULTISPECIES: hypothetical protein [unclassified Lentimonas]|uniref:hypothetical protein n=1 Tax=unclassified Lentimonas TaxID=2630993 RepID=UPI0013298883|nr:MULTISPECIES: hypothetical protein [unclassified Lentimonas]CAA6678320.1 Unannotated [Lentimonas sp. CC4]CAA6685412.1 Unannotated [Lentimonas sp. CC6]CAA6690606.1 Unannotated [Lentimonas sp. CC10]CAA6695261.1 Unannotated [Lentimonas sp. CC19]CAA7068863.1 Unannotated [Lentimonas sp. CC11]
MLQLLNKAKRLFLRMSVREKLLTLLFILVMLFIWTGSLLSRASALNDHRQLAQADLEIQQHWLDRSDEYSVGLANALERVDPQKTYAGSQLSGRIFSILRKVALSDQADIDPVQTREGEIFNDHNVRIRLSRISIAQLIQFNKLLSQETPYINLQSVRVTKNRKKPEELDARFQINSFDLNNSFDLKTQ